MEKKKQHKATRNSSHHLTLPDAYILALLVAHIGGPKSVKSPGQVYFPWTKTWRNDQGVPEQNAGRHVACEIQASGTDASYSSTKSQKPFGTL